MDNNDINLPDHVSKLLHNRISRVFQADTKIKVKENEVEEVSTKVELWPTFEFQETKTNKYQRTCKKPRSG